MGSGNTPESDAVDFVANLLQQKDSLSRGFSGCLRWWCLREDVKETFRAQARDIIAEWAEGERTEVANMEAKTACG